MQYEKLNPLISILFCGVRYTEIAGQTNICDSFPFNEIMVLFGYIWNKTHALSAPAKSAIIIWEQHKVEKEVKFQI